MFRRKVLLVFIFFLGIFGVICLRFNDIKAKIASADELKNYLPCNSCGKSGSPLVSGGGRANFSYASTMFGTNLLSTDSFNNVNKSRNIVLQSGFEPGYSIRFMIANQGFSINSEFNNSYRMATNLVPKGYIMDSDQMIIVNKSGDYIRAYGSEIGERYSAVAVGGIVSSYSPNGKKLYLARPTVASIAIQENDGTKYDFNSYSNVFRLMAITDPLGNKTIYSRNSRGDLLTISDPFGNFIFKAIYDEAGNLMSATDANGEITSVVVDTNQRVSIITHPDGRQDKFYYVDDANNINVKYLNLVKKHEPAGGGEMVLSYDNNLVPAEIWTTDSKITMDYGSNYIKATDLKGNVNGIRFTTTNCASGKVCVESFDVPNGPADKVGERLLSRTTYGAYSFVPTGVVATDNRKEYLVEEIKSSQLTNGDLTTPSTRTVYTYNTVLGSGGYGMVSRVDNYNNAGAVTDSEVYTYNYNGDLIVLQNIVNPGYKSLYTNFAYTYLPLPISYINPAVKVYGLSKILYPDGQYEEYTYNGSQISSEKLNGQIRREYAYYSTAPYGRIYTDTDKYGGTSFTTTYVWNSNGTPNQITDPQGNVAKYTYETGKPLALAKVEVNNVLVENYERQYDSATQFTKSLIAKTTATDLNGGQTVLGQKTERYITTDPKGAKTTIIAKNNSIFRGLDVFAETPKTKYFAKTNEVIAQYFGKEAINYGGSVITASFSSFCPMCGLAVWPLAGYCPTVAIPTPAYSLQVTKVGSGIADATVNSADGSVALNLGTPDITVKYQNVTEQILTVVPDSNSEFVSWSGCDSVDTSVSPSKCKKTVKANPDIITVNLKLINTPTPTPTATPTPTPTPTATTTTSPTTNPTISPITTGTIMATVIAGKSGSGSGNITSSPAGIYCGTNGSICSYQWPAGQKVTFTAVPNTGSTFVQWDLIPCTSITNSSCTAALSPGTTLVQAQYSASPTPIVTQ